MTEAEYAQELIGKAIKFATDAHNTQTRKGTTLPYILHLMEAGAIAASITEEPEVIAAAILHDTLEDTAVTPEQLSGNFGKYILRLVTAASENKYRERPEAETWQQRKQETIDKIPHLTTEEQIVVLADKLSNIRTTYAQYRKSPTTVFERFNVKDPKMHQWYYTSILKALDKVRNTCAYLEFHHICLAMFDDVRLEDVHAGGHMWCAEQTICDEDIAAGSFTCTAHLADGRAFVCPYASAEDRAKAEHPCQDYSPAHKTNS